MQRDGADDDGGAGDAEGDGCSSLAALTGVHRCVDALLFEQGDERGFDLVGERAGGGELAVIGGDAGLEEGFELCRLPPHEVGEVDGLELACGGGGELDDECFGVDGVADVAEEAGVDDALEGFFDGLLCERLAGREGGDAEDLGGVGAGWCLDADGLGGVGLGSGGERRRERGGLRAGVG